MDLDAVLKYGKEEVMIPIRGAKSIVTLATKPMPVIEDIEAELKKGLESPIGSKPLKELISADDEVTIVVSDYTRAWMHQGAVLTILGHYLTEEMQVPFSHIEVVIALGTHRKSTDAEKKLVAGDYLYEHCNVTDHDCDGPCVNLGTTSRGTVVEVNPLIVGRKTIIVGGTVHHMMAGFGGGRKNILPGVSSRRTIRQNHERALDPVKPQTYEKVGSGLMVENPIHEDMYEAAALAAPTFGINIVADTKGNHSGFFCGDGTKAWAESCLFQKSFYECPIEKEADIVICSTGGYPKDLNLYQGCKGLINSMRAVKKGGLLLWLCRCEDGTGAPDYTSWLAPLKEGRLTEALRSDFTIGGYIFFLTIETLQKAECRIMSLIEKETTDTMGMTGTDNIEDLLAGVDFTGKDVCIMPHGSIVPMEK